MALDVQGVENCCQRQNTCRNILNTNNTTWYCVKQNERKKEKKKEKEEENKEKKVKENENKKENENENKNKGKNWKIVKTQNI